MRLRTPKDRTDPRAATRDRVAASTGMTCRTCGLEITTFALRCPRCLEPLPLGCNGNCRDCGKGCS